MAPPQQSSQPLSSQIETLSLVSGLVEAFKAFDSDNDRLITEEEFGAMIASLGYDASDNQVEEMMRMGDSDGDGLLSITEVVSMLSEANAGDLAGVLGTVLATLDDEGTTAGTVSVEELYELLSCMGSLSPDDCRDIIASLDGDGDGAINLEDLKLVVQALL